MSGGLDLPQWGLPPHKKRQASLGALNPKHTASRHDETVQVHPEPQHGGDAVARFVRWLLVTVLCGFSDNKTQADQ
jgi:hypothetical protein